MAKNIIIGVLSIALVGFIILGIAKSKEAENQVLLSQQTLDWAREAARKQEEKAIYAVSKAMITEEKMEEIKKELKDCRAGK